jgi:hypothetical protein
VQIVSKKSLKTWNISNNKLIKIGGGFFTILLVVVVDAFPDLAHVVLYCPKHTHRTLKALMKLK